MYALGIFGGSDDSTATPWLVKVGMLLTEVALVLGLDEAPSLPPKP